MIFLTQQKGLQLRLAVLRMLQHVNCMPESKHSSMRSDCGIRLAQWVYVSEGYQNDMTWWSCSTPGGPSTCPNFRFSGTTCCCIVHKSVRQASTDGASFSSLRIKPSCVSETLHTQHTHLIYIVSMSLLATLPAPKQQQGPIPAAALVAPPAGASSTALVISVAPPYPRRKGFVPRKQDDFGDGGAYPELPLLQYPLDMGRSDEQKGGKTLAVSVDINGAANYDAILRQGQRANKIIHSGHQALVPKVDLLDPQVGVGGALVTRFEHMTVPTADHKQVQPVRLACACMLAC